MNQEIVGAQLATLFGIIIVLVITGCIAGHQVFQSTEPFSPLGFASNCPPTGAKLPDRSRFRVKDCGPGCYLQSEVGKGKEEFHDADHNDCTTDKIPDFQKQLPIGHLSTMGSPLTGQASCTSGVNNVQRLGDSNPYGELVKKYGTEFSKANQFTQSYAACDFGSNNIFNKNMLKY